MTRVIAVGESAAMVKLRREHSRMIQPLSNRRLEDGDSLRGLGRITRYRSCRARQFRQVTDQRAARPTATSQHTLSVRDAVDDRGTLPALFDPLNAEHRFTLDAAASDNNAKCGKYFTRQTDGLLRSWRGERVWCNPPYSRLAPWLAKAWLEMHSGCELIVMLLPANRTEQRFWQEYVEPFRDGPVTDGISLRSRFLRGRTRFVMPAGFQYYTTKGKGDRPPFGCCLLTWERTVSTLSEYVTPNLEGK